MSPAFQGRRRCHHYFNEPGPSGLLSLILNLHMETKVPEQDAAATPQASTPAPAQPEAAPAAEPATENTVNTLAPAAEEPAAAPAEEPAEAPAAEAPAAEADAEPAEPVDEAEAEAISALDIAGTLARAEEILARDAAKIGRDEVSHLRQHFAALRKEKTDAELQAFCEAGGNQEEFVPAPCPEEEKFKEILNAIKEKKAAHLAAVEAEQAANLEKKNAIIDEIRQLAGDTDNVNRSYPRYRELQDAFNAIGDVPAPEETALWKRYQEAREQFSDNLKINKELRDYDFKKNLELKEVIIAEAAKLDAESDVVTAFRRLQELHAKWRQIGPVAKELRDDVWNRFKEATLAVNRRYQTHFEERKAREAENEAGKIAICERVEAIDFSQLKSFSAWDQMTETLKQAQEDWKKLGFASRKMNNALFTRFRATCDTFFALKAAYFKSAKEELARNLAAKTALAEKAEALKDSKDWKKTTDELVALQKEWKGIGTVSRKYSDQVWKRFQQACDHFFEQKKAATSGQRKTEQANLQAKRDLIKELDKINAEMSADDARALISDLQERWKLIGHVPFREKDAVYEAFRNRINEVRAEFDLGTPGRRRERYDNQNEGGGSGRSERERQMRLLETRRAELRTYENNLCFLNATSKSGNSLVQGFERKIERLKADIAALEEKVRNLDAEL